MVDGWTVTMADSEENQEEYPQMAGQKPGCGFPIARMIGLFSLATGAINFTAMAAYQGKQTGETSLLRIILDRILPGRILLADRYYASFWLLAMSELRNIDLVARAHHLRKVDFRRGLKQGYLDQIVAYHRPERPSWMGKEVRAAMLVSALKIHLCPTQLSFTGAMQALEEFASCIRHRSGRYAEQWESLLQTISELTVGKRPGRQERRELKRRQKRYKLMQKPRDPNRNRYATAA